MSQEPLIKLSVTSRRRPGPQSPPSHDELFLELYKSALQGCCSQYEMNVQPGHKPYYTEGDGELQRARQLARRAWNTAAYGCQLFETRDFNGEVGLF